MEEKIKIMFVDDDPEMTATYVENFSSPEFQVSAEHNGSAALAKLKQPDARVDVLVTDNCMPGMDGLTLLKKIREQFPSIKVIIVTGHGNWTDYVDAQNSGVCRFIDKPVKMAELKRLIAELFHRS